MTPPERALLMEFSDQLSAAGRRLLADSEWLRLETAEALGQSREALRRATATRAPALVGAGDTAGPAEPRDAAGDWLCAVCREPIRAPASVVRRRDRVVHLRCAEPLDHPYDRPRPDLP